MNAETVRKVIARYGYVVSTLDTNEGDTFYFRTDDFKFVIKAVVYEDRIEIDRANEDFYEKYPVDFYDYHGDAVFTFAELIEYGWIDEEALA